MHGSTVGISAWLVQNGSQGKARSQSVRVCILLSLLISVLALAALHGDPAAELDCQSVSIVNCLYGAAEVVQASLLGSESRSVPLVGMQVYDKRRNSSIVHIE